MGESVNFPNDDVSCATARAKQMTLASLGNICNERLDVGVVMIRLEQTANGSDACRVGLVEIHQLLTPQLAVVLFKNMADQ